MKRQIIPTLAGLIILFALGWYVDSLIHAEIVTTARTVLYSVAFVAILAAVCFSILFVLLVRERVLTVQAKRKQEQQKADVYAVVSPEHGVYVRELNKQANWLPLHNIPNWRINGRSTEPSQVEVMTWQTWQTAHHTPKVINQQALLPATIEQEPLDLLTVFTQPTQSYAIIGGQQTGKTFQARHIALYWLKNGLKPIVIGPKWDRGEWAGCILLGGNGDFSAVGKGIAIVRAIAEKRHASSDLSHKEHNILPVFFDDWTPIVDAIPEARQLVLEATTLYASVNIILYFILHSDTADAWGVARKGAALKDNFIKLHIQPHYDATGLIVREKTRGYIRFSGDKAERPVRLFNTPVISYPARESLLLPEIEPNEQEALILQLKVEGKSNREISQTIWGEGKYGVFYNQKIDKVIEKFGEK